MLVLLPLGWGAAAGCWHLAVGDPIFHETQGSPSRYPMTDYGSPYMCLSWPAQPLGDTPEDLLYKLTFFMRRFHTEGLSP